MRNLRTLTHEAISAGHLTTDANPFLHFTIRQEKTEHRFLKPEELATIEKTPLKGILKHVRDAFLFCCYTGLRFSDFKRISPGNLSEMNGKPWLHIKTEKTGYHVQIPLSLIFKGKALRILKRYPTIEDFTNIGSNAQVNRQLAELQNRLGIRTRITFHTARHTCATPRRPNYDHTEDFGAFQPVDDTSIFGSNGRHDCKGLVKCQKQGVTKKPPPNFILPSLLPS